MNETAMDASPFLPGSAGTGQAASAGPGSFSLGMARILVDYSARAYQESNVDDPFTDAQALVTTRGDSAGVKIVVAFRGSCTPKDFIQDAKFGMRLLGYSTVAHPAQVHAGFLEDAAAIDSEVTKRVREALAAHPEAEVYVTGHSLGGAIALLCAVELRRVGIPIAGVYTFGQPRVGNAAWATMYKDMLGDRTFRVVNENDIVPRTPGLLLGYRHCGNLALILPWNDLVINPSWLTKLLSDGDGLYQAYLTRKDVLITDHFFARYQDALAKLR